MDRNRNLEFDQFFSSHTGMNFLELQILVSQSLQLKKTTLRLRDFLIFFTCIFSFFNILTVWTMILDDLFVPMEQLRATHFAFGLCFIRVPAVWKGVGKVISIMPKALVLPRFYMGFFNSVEK